jgi:ketosteroid isomerase-like protein
MSADERSPGVPGGPRDAVHAWWRAMQSGDIETLERLALDSYMSCGGPDGQTSGRDALLEGAAAFFAEAIVERCAVDDIEMRELGGVAVCCYRWTESGRHRGEAFEFSGFATDVLVRRDGRWHYQAHHVSMSAA